MRMKKLRLLSFLGLLFTSVSLLAQTEQEARTAAMKFLQQKKGGVSLSLTSTKLMDGQAVVTKARGKSANAQVKGGDVYAFNAEGGGFAVVCTGNGNTAIAGYSDKGKVDVTCMPDAMKEWLADYAMAMSYDDSQVIQEPTWIGPTIKPVAPLLKTHWGQGAPYNGKCPSDGKQTTLAGCVPVALAQVLNYYRSDNKGTGTLYYAHTQSETEYDIDYSNTSYDWNNMLDSYEEGKYTQVQADAVAKLILECGVASKAKYDYSATSAALPFVALNKYYNFDCMVALRDVSMSVSMFTYSHYYTATKKWITTIQKELEAGRPIIYSGSDRKNGGGGYYINPSSEHCFVIDGIDDKNYVHCNWGWSGMEDGYYDIALLNPASQKFYYEQGYRCNHEMIVGIQPRTTPYEKCLYQVMAPADWFNTPGWSVKSRKNIVKLSDTMQARTMSTDTVSSKDRMYYFVASNSYEDETFGISPVLVRNGVIKLVLGSYQASVDGWSNINFWDMADSFHWPYHVEDGNYELRLASWPIDGSQEMKICPMPDSLVATVDVVKNGTAMVFHGLEGDGLVDSLRIDNITPASEIYAGTTFYLYITASGGSSSSKLIFRNVDTGKAYGGSKGGSFEIKHVYDDYTSTTPLSFKPLNVDNEFSMPVGRYKIELPEDETNVTLASDFYIDVKPAPEYPVMDGYEWGSLSYYGSSSYDNEIAKKNGYATLYNTYNYMMRWVRPRYSYANKTEAPIVMNVYMVNMSTGEEWLVGQKKDWVPGQAVPLNLYCYPTGNFRFRCRYVTPEGESAGLQVVSDSQEKKRINDGTYFDYRVLYADDANRTTVKLVSAVGKRENGEQKLEVVLQRMANSQLSGCTAKAFFYDKEHGEVIVDTIARKINARTGETFKLMFSPSLREDAEYTVDLLFSDYFNNDNYYYNFVLDDDYEVAEIKLDRNGVTSGINMTRTSNDGIFEEGDVVKIYNLEGTLVKTVVASGSLWVNLQSQLPDGTYILKSTSKTIKFRK